MQSTTISNAPLVLASMDCRVMRGASILSVSAFNSFYDPIALFTSWRARSWCSPHLIIARPPVAGTTCGITRWFSSAMSSLGVLLREALVKQDFADDGGFDGVRQTFQALDNDSDIFLPHGAIFKRRDVVDYTDYDRTGR